jgi:hypothetical protein
MLFFVEAKLRRAKRYAHQRRGAIVEQLNLPTLIEETETATPVWNLLDNEQRANVVALLARLIAQAVAMTPMREDDNE